MVKVLSVSDDVYEALKSLKREGESFTGLLRRLVRKTSISEKTLKRLTERCDSNWKGDRVGLC